jgi:hypothetical protein
MTIKSTDSNFSTEAVANYRNNWDNIFGKKKSTRGPKKAVRSNPPISPSESYLDTEPPDSEKLATVSDLRKGS